MLLTFYVVGIFFVFLQGGDCIRFPQFNGREKCPDALTDSKQIPNCKKWFVSDLLISCSCFFLFSCWQKNKQEMVLFFPKISAFF